MRYYVPEAVVHEHVPMKPVEPSTFFSRGVPEDIIPPPNVQQQHSVARRARLHVSLRVHDWKAQQLLPEATEIEHPGVHYSGRERKPDVH